MKEIVGISAAVIALALLAVHVLAVDITADVTVPATCGITANSINFPSLVPGTTSGDVTSTISMPSGNTPVTPTVQGTQWSDGGVNTMVVGQTRWHLTSGTAYGSMNALTGTGVSLGDTVSYGDPLPVYFKLAIPDGQAAASYSQTITFTVTC